MLAPNFHALPRNTFGKLISPSHRVGRSVSRSETGWGRSTRDLRREVLEHLARMRDHARDRAGRRDCRVCEVDLGFRVVHAAGELADGRVQVHIAVTWYLL